MNVNKNLSTTINGRDILAEESSGENNHLKVFFFNSQLVDRNLV